MAERIDAERRREQLARVRGEQNALLRLSHSEFRQFCHEVATMRRDPVPGLLQRLRRERFAGGVFGVDPRITDLRRAEEMVVDQLDREQLVRWLDQGRLTRHMCDYWLRRRPKEVPRINGLPVWLAVFSADVAA
jgi:hypothetical protein